MTIPVLLCRSLPLFVTGFLAAPAFGQGDLEFDGTVPITYQGNSLYLAWSGGINFAQFSQVDLDQDGLTQRVTATLKKHLNSLFDWDSQRYRLITPVN